MKWIKKYYKNIIIIIWYDLKDWGWDDFLVGSLINEWVNPDVGQSFWLIIFYFYFIN